MAQASPPTRTDPSRLPQYTLRQLAQATSPGYPAIFSMLSQAELAQVCLHELDITPPSSNVDIPQSKGTYRLQRPIIERNQSIH